MATAKMSEDGFGCVVGVGGYNVDIVSHDHYMMYCLICEKLMNNPIQFKCSHGSCRSCYESLLRKADLR